MRRLPLQHSIPFLEPMKLLCHACPELFRISQRFSANTREFLLRLDVCALREICRWRKHTLLVLQRINVSCRHNPGTPKGNDGCLCTTHTCLTQQGLTCSMTA